MTFSQHSFAKDIFAEHKVNALKSLRSVVVVVRPNTPFEIVSLNELQNWAEISLYRDLPNLKLSDSTSESDWLEIGIVTTKGGGAIEVSLYRWVTVMKSGEEVISKVWWDAQFIFGRTSKTDLRDALDTILTRFSADYIRSKR